MSENLKRCSVCAEPKPRTEFFRDASRPDGLAYQCKPCFQERIRLSRRANSETRRRISKSYRQRRAEHIRAQKIAWRAANPEKMRAHWTVKNAIRDGRMVRPAACERCATTERRIDAHHEDYAALLDVIWLCSRCHAERHRELRDEAAA